jgi:hypothetical protein
MRQIPTINREALAKLESYARDLGFRIRGRNISEEEDKEARASLHLAPKGFGKDVRPRTPERGEPFPFQPETEQKKFSEAVHRFGETVSKFAFEPETEQTEK